MTNRQMTEKMQIRNEIAKQSKQTNSEYAVPQFEFPIPKSG
jgi:hypothetical protein